MKSLRGYCVDHVHPADVIFGHAYAAWGTGEAINILAATIATVNQ